MMSMLGILFRTEEKTTGPVQNTDVVNEHVMFWDQLFCFERDEHGQEIAGSRISTVLSQNKFLSVTVA